MFYLLRALASPAAPAAERYRGAQLTCGEPAQFTSIDHLGGIASRFYYPVYPEPAVALMFRKNEFGTAQLDVIEANMQDALKNVSISSLLCIVLI